MTEVTGDPFAKGKVKVRTKENVEKGGLNSAPTTERPAGGATTPADNPLDSECLKLYGAPVEQFLTDYRAAVEGRKDLTEFRRVAEALKVPIEQFFKALYPRDYATKRKA